jgi:flagellar biosynthesis protein FliP
MTDIAAHVLAQPKLGSPADLLAALFILGLVPVLAISVTSFTRISVVLGLLRASFGSTALPPNSVLVALAIMLSGAIMAPTISDINRQSILPYQAHRVTASQAFARAQVPLRSFMLKQTRADDLNVFGRIARVSHVEKNSVPFSALAPAFLVSELRTAFAMGFALALPFAVIDIVIAIVLMSLGMFMVSPGTISLPVKLLLFVAVDGWTLVSGALAASYR